MPLEAPVTRAAALLRDWLIWNSFSKRSSGPAPRRRGYGLAFCPNVLTRRLETPVDASLLERRRHSKRSQERPADRPVGIQSRRRTRRRPGGARANGFRRATAETTAP